MKITMELANEVNAMYGLPSVDKVLAMVNGSEVKPKPKKTNSIVTKMQAHMIKVKKALNHHRAEKDAVNDFFKDLS